MIGKRFVKTVFECVVFLVYDCVKNPAALIHHVMFQTGKYQEYTEFHADMLLVKSNCLKYNPPGHEIHQVSSIP